MKRLLFPTLTVAFAAFMAIAPASAVVITPGSTVSAVADDDGGLAAATAGALLGTTGPIAFSIGTKITGTFTQSAYSNPSNPWGAGLVTLVYEFENDATSGGNILRMTTSDFTGVFVDVGFAGSLGFESPDIFTRTTVDAIGVNWDPAIAGAGAEVNPGDVADPIIIHTDQPLVSLTGETALINGSATTFATFAAVPEPSAFLYGGVIAGIAGLGYRRRWFASSTEENEV